MQRWMKWAGTAVIALVVLYVVGGGVAAGLFVGHLLTPGAVDWSGAGKPAPTDPLALGYRGDPKAALGLAYSTIRYETELGPADAWLVPAARPSTTWAVYVHGIGGIRENGYKQLSILNEAGLPTLLINYRNDAGAPAGRPPFYSFGLTEWRDLDSAVGWMLDNGAERIVLVAESMGGGIAGQFLRHSDKAGKVVALVLDSPALDFQQVVERVLGKFHLPVAPALGMIAMQTVSIEGQAPFGETRTVETVADFPGPIFLAQGRADSLVPISIAEDLVRLRQGKGPIVFLETSADHLLSFAEDPARYRRQLLAFLAALPPGA